MTEPTNLNLSQYDELAARHNAAYAAFKAIFETRTPPPLRPVVLRDSLFIPVALCIMIIASVLVSGSRTVLEFGGGAVGVSAFVMLEGAIVTYAFFRTRINFDDSRMEQVRTLANRGLVLSFAVAVAANVHSVIKGAGIETPAIVTIAILILVAISAPTLAFISGDIMALELMRNSYKARKAEAEYSAAYGQWATDLNTAWTREKSRWGVKVEVEAAPALSNGVNPVKSSNLLENTRFVPSRKLQLALDYFDIHPEHLGEESRKLVEIIGVSHTTINKAQRMKRGIE